VGKGDGKKMSARVTGKFVFTIALDTAPKTNAWVEIPPPWNAIQKTRSINSDPYK